MYVPKDVRDPNEILFTGYNGRDQARRRSQRSRLRSTSSSTVFRACANARGRILSRNACRNPWQNEVDVSIAQSLEAFRAQNLQLRLDVINFGNLLNPHWGRQLFSDQGATCGSICSATVLLSQTRQQARRATNAQTQGVFTFDPTLRPYSAQNASSNYRMQLSLRYSF